ncbi:MAG: hypothetical protein PHS84_02710 [Paludibacter sp.]|nr:hypothetical protein [Paludibacter sp.]
MVRKKPLNYQSIVTDIYKPDDRNNGFGQLIESSLLSNNSSEKIRNNRNLFEKTEGLQTTVNLFDS